MLQIAWCVARTAGSSGRMDPLSFPSVILNEGGAWCSAYNYVVIPRTGLYFIHVSVGVGSNSVVEYNVVQSGNVIYDISRDYTSTGVDTLSRTGLLRLTSGTQLKITSYPTYSNSLMQTSFMGFFIL